MVPEHLADPLRWRKPRRIFVNSMSDLFHEKLTNEEIAAVFGVMAAAPQHTFQVLTKRAKRMRGWFEWLSDDPARRIAEGLDDVAKFNDRVDARLADDEFQVAVINYINGMSTWRWHLDEHPLGVRRWPLPNVWLGVSTENQETYVERVRDLHYVPAAVHFISAEPLIGAIDMKADCINPGWLSWVIAGCESGPGARACEPGWLRSLRDQCAAAGVPYFLKQAQGVDERHAYGGDICAGPGSKRKAGHVIELPYLDGVRHAAFPEVRRG
jgi:protein gp37